ncbi:MAG: RIP metalloprotease RseP [Proteobacteria bacterium]|nr:RIP metalloprotease RseP [Pseudomonadota bacterium]
MGTDFIAFIIVLGVLIFIHELGHFLVARYFGVGIEKFSLGFGPRLFGKKVGITDYRVSAVPLGGYVKMVGEDPDAELDPEDISISYSHKHVFKRILIVAAGPTFNILLAAVIYFGFFSVVGIEDVTPVIRNIDIGGPAQKAGLAKGDLILSIDKAPVDSWYDIFNAIKRSDGRTLSLNLKRDDSEIAIALSPQLNTGQDLFGDEVKYYDLGISGYPEIEAIIGGVSNGFPAQVAGLEKNDKIVAINGEKVNSWNKMQKIILESQGKILLTTIQRGDSFFDVKITPVLKKNKNALGEIEESYKIGVSSAGGILPDEDKFLKKFSVIEALFESVRQTYRFTHLTIVSIAKLIQGKLSINTLGGPIMIAEMAGQQAREGASDFLFFMALISINLAVLNFLPIPVLDGGHLFFYFIEAAIGKPVNTKIREIAQQVGIFVLILLMIFVFYNDITRYFFS